MTEQGDSSQPLNDDDDALYPNKHHMDNRRYPRQVSRYPTRAAMDRLTADLRLAYVGPDRDLLAADARRVVEFLDYYDTQPLNDDERFTLMSLIVASFDNSLRTGRDEVVQQRIVACLTAGFGVLNYLVQYWALPDENGADDGFRFTPIARKIMQSQYGEREHWPRSPRAIMRAAKWLPEPGVYNSVEIVDNRDGTVQLSWSKTAGLDGGRYEFLSITAATEFARQRLGLAVEQWS